MHAQLHQRTKPVLSQSRASAVESSFASSKTDMLPGSCQGRRTFGSDPEANCKGDGDRQALQDRGWSSSARILPPLDKGRLQQVRSTPWNAAD